MRTYTHAQGDIEKISLYLPLALDHLPVDIAKAKDKLELVKMHERTIKYGGVDVLVLQINTGTVQYAIVPGIIRGHEKSDRKIKTSYIDPISNQEDQEKVREILNDLGLEGCIHFWEEELEN